MHVLDSELSGPFGGPAMKTDCRATGRGAEHFDLTESETLTPAGPQSLERGFFRREETAKVLHQSPSLSFLDFVGSTDSVEKSRAMPLEHPLQTG